LNSQLAGHEEKVNIEPNMSIPLTDPLTTP
jgi:hypothetical protein